MRETRTSTIPLEATGNKIGGYAIVWDSPATIRDSAGRAFTEVVRRESISLAAEKDILCCLNHDVNQLLGRTSSKTLTLRQDQQGLYYECVLPEYLKPKIQEQIQRGDLTGCSFTFEIKRDKWSRRDNTPYRELLDIEVFEVGPVVSPAYKTTSVSLRSVPEIEAGPSYFDMRLRLIEKNEKQQINRFGF